jgi:acyl dehydratase
MKPGDSVPPLERTIEQPDMIAYAGATWDWHRLHYDPAYARGLGFPKPVVDGQMLGALLAEQLLDWLGPRAFVTKLAFRFRSPVTAGETVRCEGEVTAVEDGHATVAQRVLAGDRIAVEATARVRLP